MAVNHFVEVTAIGIILIALYLQHDKINGLKVQLKVAEEYHEK